MQIYVVKFKFTFEDQAPVVCVTQVEAESFSEAQYKACKFMVDCLELCSVSEV